MTTFCCAAIATTTGMYMAPQKPMTHLAFLGHAAVATTNCADQQDLHPAHALDLDSQQDAGDMSPRITPANMQIASNATP